MIKNNLTFTSTPDKVLVLYQESELPKKTRIQIAKPDIVKHFENIPEKIYKKKNISSVFYDKRSFWRLKQEMTVEEFINFMVKYSKLTRHRLKFPKITHTIYTWGKEISNYEIVSSLHSNSYLSHYTAAFIHEITEDLPKTIYVTVPQPPKRSKDIRLTQEQINSAFDKPPRATKNITKLKGFRVALLKGMETQQIGITSGTAPDESTIRLSNIERTLIDITVRPFYAGGVYNVLKAFRLAAGRMSTNKLVAVLKKINFVYPYHQAIGFYMEHSGAYSKNSIDLIKKIERTQDFFLSHGMGEKDYNADWRLYIPKGFQ